VEKRATGKQQRALKKRIVKAASGRPIYQILELRVPSENVEMVMLADIQRKPESMRDKW
jgi:hypothetical protein